MSLVMRRFFFLMVVFDVFLLTPPLFLDDSLEESDEISSWPPLDKFVRAAFFNNLPSMTSVTKFAPVLTSCFPAVLATFFNAGAIVRKRLENIPPIPYPRWRVEPQKNR